MSFVAYSVLTDAQFPDLERVDLDDVDKGSVVRDGDVMRQLQAFISHVEGTRELVRFQVNDVALK